MNIMIVGVCDVEHSTNTFMANAFKNLGHKVICYNYRTRLRVYYGDLSKLENDFIRTVTEVKKHEGIDLIIFCKTDGLPVTAHIRATEMCKTFYWFMDPITTAQVMFADMRASACTAASATCMEVVDYFRKYGQQNSYKINEGVDLELFKPISFEKKHDVLFVGSQTQERMSHIDYLAKAGIRVKVFGDGWHGKFGAMHPIYNASLVSEINQAKIVLNVSRTNSYSDRVTLSMASGAFVITSDVNEIHIDFISGKHLETFATREELYEKVTYYLKNEEERKKVAAQGCSFIRSRAGWETVCVNILYKVVNYDYF
jgi:spore maturation protein CgeB